MSALPGVSLWELTDTQVKLEASVLSSHSADISTPPPTPTLSLQFISNGCSVETSHG